ncbi:Ulp1 protease-like protein 1 [Elsinoe fawcettii]|nr:Ulp1 protease-like protein 1 [Elsinoe fawcettii]
MSSIRESWFLSGILSTIKSVTSGVTDHRRPNLHNSLPNYQERSHKSPSPLPEQSSYGPVRLGGALTQSHELEPTEPRATSQRRLPGALPESVDCVIIDAGPLTRKTEIGDSHIRAQKYASQDTYSIHTSGIVERMGKPPAGGVKPQNTLDRNKTLNGSAQPRWSGTHRRFPSDEVPPRDLRAGSSLSATQSSYEVGPPKKKVKTSQSSSIKHSFSDGDQAQCQVDDIQDDQIDAKRAGAQTNHASFMQHGRTTRRQPGRRGNEEGVSIPVKHYRPPTEDVVDLSSPPRLPPSSSAASQRTAMEEAYEQSNHFRKGTESEDELMESSLHTRNRPAKLGGSGKVSNPIQIQDSSLQTRKNHPTRSPHFQSANSVGLEGRPRASPPSIDSSHRQTGRTSQARNGAAPKQDRSKFPDPIHTSSSFARPLCPTRKLSTPRRASPEMQQVTPLSARIKDRLRDTATPSDGKRKPPKIRRVSSADILDGPPNIHGPTCNSEQSYPIQSARGSEIQTGPGLPVHAQQPKGRKQITVAIEKPDHVSDSEPEADHGIQQTPSGVAQSGPHVLEQSTADSKPPARILQRLLGPSSAGQDDPGDTMDSPHGLPHSQSPELEIEEKTTQMTQEPPSADTVAIARAPETVNQESIVEEQTSQPKSKKTFEKSVKEMADNHKIRDDGCEIVDASQSAIGSRRSSSRLHGKTQTHIDLDAKPQAPKAPRWYDQQVSQGKAWKQPLVYPLDGPKKVTVEFSDLERLEDGEMLNDNLIAFELRRLQIKYPHLAKDAYFFNSFFYDSLTKTPNGRKGFNYDNVKSWTRKVDIFAYPYIVVPVNSAAHWYVFIICNVDKLVPKPVEDNPDGPPVSSQTSMPEQSRTDAGSLPPRTDDPDNLDMRKIDLDPSGTENVPPSSIVPSSSQNTFQVPDSDDDEKAQLKAIFKAAATKRSGRPIDPRTPVIMVLDSMEKSHTGEIAHLKSYLVHEARDKRGVEIAKTDITSISAKGIPYQSDMFNCGVFLLGYLETFSRDPQHFVRKVCSREMDENNDFADFDAGEKRSHLREIIVKFHRTQTRTRREARDMKRKASEAGNTEEQGRSSPVKKAKTEASSAPSSPAIVDNVPVERGAADGPATVTVGRVRSRDRHNDIARSSPLKERNSDEEQKKTQTLLSGLQEAATETAANIADVATNIVDGHAEFLAGIGMAASQH